MQRFLRTFLILFLVVSPGRPTSAVDVISLDGGDIGLARAFKQLATTVSVMHVVAHPDDEDGPLLAYCARGLGARTMLFSVTRGEGGANLVSGDFFDRLGALRSLEHVKSASYYGNELFYSRAVDYGYSKTIDEAKRQWQNGEPILADLVEVIRRERPTIVLSRFRGDHHDGHGHHQLAGVLSEQAVIAAADPAAFPEQIARGLRPWQVAKLYSNNLRPDWRPEDQELWTVAIPTGTFDHTLGKSFAQIARFGLGFQRSQGFGGHEGEPGRRDSYYRLVRLRGEKVGRLQENSILDGIDPALTAALPEDLSPDTRRRIERSLHEMAANIDQSQSAFVTNNRPVLVDSLLSSLQSARLLSKTLPQEPLSESQRSSLDQLLTRKIGELQHAIGCAMAVEWKAIASLQESIDSPPRETRYVAPGETIRVQIRAIHQHAVPLEIRDVSLAFTEGPTVEVTHSSQSWVPNEVASIEQTITIPTTMEPTRPTWSRPSIQRTLYDVTENHAFEPLPRPALNASIHAVIRDVDVFWQIPVEVVYRDAVKGDVRYPLDVVPALRVGFALSNGVLPHGTKDYQVELIAGNPSSHDRSVRLDLEVPEGWTSQSQNPLPQKLTANETVRVTYLVHPPANVSDERVLFKARLTDSSTQQSYEENFVEVTAPDLGRVHWYFPAEHHLNRIDVRVAGAPRVGYIRGSGDEVAESLRWIGIRPEFLEAGDLAARDLQSFDVILVGVRAYAVRDDLRRWNSRLLEYVHAGGTLIVQYQTPEFDQNFGPFPYSMSDNPEEVSEEDAEITILDKPHRLFHFPNEITDTDFDQWVEQRGSKFWKSWDPRYVPLLECHDTDQAPQQGGLLMAQHGRGTYVYAAYSWYRQLPQGVPGAYRLMANLLSLPMKPTQ